MRQWLSSRGLSRTLCLAALCIIVALRLGSSFVGRPTAQFSSSPRRTGEPNTERRPRTSGRKLRHERRILAMRKLFAETDSDDRYGLLEGTTAVNPDLTCALGSGWASGVRQANDVSCRKSPRYPQAQFGGGAVIDANTSLASSCSCEHTEGRFTGRRLRYRRRNHDASRFDDATDEYRSKLLAAINQRCSKSGRTMTGIRQRSTNFTIVGLEATAPWRVPGWQRFWILQQTPIKQHGDGTTNAPPSANAGPALAGTDSSGLPLENHQCYSGAHTYYGVSIEGTADGGRPFKLAVDRQESIGPGVTEVRYFAAWDGKLRVCVDMAMSVLHGGNGTEDNVLFVLNSTTVGSVPGYLREYRDAKYSRSDDATRPPFCTPRGHTKQCVTVSKQAAVERLGSEEGKKPRVSCRGWRDYASGGGAWVQLADRECDGIHCTGDLASLHSDGWVWAPHDCVLHIFNRTEAWTLLNRRWVLGWGGSTMKQPMANTVEYLLGRQVFDAGFMEQIPALHKAEDEEAARILSDPKKLKSMLTMRGTTTARAKASPSSASPTVPGFYEYRNWDIEREQLAEGGGAGGAASVTPHVDGNDTARSNLVTRFTMVFSGCRAKDRGMCTRTGMNTRDKIRRYIPLTPMDVNSSTAPKPPTPHRLRAKAGGHKDGGSVEWSVPDVIVMAHYHWRSALFHEQLYVGEMNATLHWLTNRLRRRLAEHEAADTSSSSAAATSNDDRDRSQRRTLTKGQMKKRVLVIWNTPTHFGFTEKLRCRTPHANVDRHHAWVMEDLFHELAIKERCGRQPRSSSCQNNSGVDKGQRQDGVDVELVLIPRHDITYPFQFGDDYVHGGVHYGATKGMCLTGFKHVGGHYALPLCHKRAFVDLVTVQLWLNALSEP